MINYCPGCFEKQRKIDQLTEEIKRLKAKLNYLERKEQEGYFGSSTPSSKVPFKTNSSAQNQHKQGGAQLGHRGHGRQSFNESQADQVVSMDSEVGDRCPQCGGPLEHRGTERRSVIDIVPVRPEKRLYVLPRQYCPRCRRVFQPHPPGVLPKSLFGNQLVATATTMHYLHGVPMGRLCEQLGVELGALIKIFHRVAKLFSSIPSRLMEQYRQASVKHADETGWPNNGHQGYGWLFATTKMSIFLFRQTRSSRVPGEVFGKDPLPGTLVVDRYHAYRKAPCLLQDCYAHLLRDIEDVGKEFPDNPEVKNFVETFGSLLASAMNLRSLPLSDDQFYEKAKEIKSQILKAVRKPAQHLAIRRIQEIFHENEHRLYRWADDRQIPADNNLAERDLRPSVIARKISFGSQSDAGANTRSILMTVLHTLKKQHSNPCSTLKTTLDQLAKNPTLDPFALLFPNDTS